MKLVFVHGVANRREPNPDKFQKNIDARHRSFSDWCFESDSVTYFDPYWGDLGAHPDKNLISIPRGSSVQLGLGGLTGGGAGDASLDQGILLQAAQRDFGAFLTAMAEAEMRPGDADSNGRADLLARYAADLYDVDGGEVDPPSYVNDASTDAELLEQLKVELEGYPEHASLGLGNWLKNTGKKVISGAISLIDGPLEKAARAATPHIARFIGDVFIYLKDGARRAQIRERIAGDLLAAARAAQSDGDKLIVLGHSMGAIILYDILSDANAVADLSAKLGSPFKIDLLLTVGTQVGLFEELDLFAHSQLDKTPGRPACVDAWWHIYNQMDVLSFGVNGIVDGVKEFSVDTGANIVDAHGAYFTSPIFHRRLRKRLIAAGLI